MLKITRSCAIAAILAGLLRATASFVPETTANVYVLYFLIDLFLLTGVIGLYLSSMTGGKMLGRLGFVLMCSALLILIARDIGVVTPNAYAVAAALFSLGLDLFAIQALRTRKIPVGIPIGWILFNNRWASGILRAGASFLVRHLRVAVWHRFYGSGGCDVASRKV